MKRNQAIDILTTNQARLKEVGVKSLAIFGSVARDEAKENSDVDLLVEFESGKLMKWGDLIAIEHQLETLLGCDVDLVTQEELKPRLRERILKEALPILPILVSNNQKITDNMPRKDWIVYVTDILEAITDIQSFTDGFNFEAFTIDKMRVKAVLHSLTIIGEAVRKIPPEIEARYPQIPWAQMRGMRNRVVHEYRTVNLEIVWDIIQNHLPDLIVQLQCLLDKFYASKLAGNSEIG